MERPQQLFFLFGTFGCHNIIISQKNKIQKYQGNAVATMKVPFFIQMLFFTHLYEFYTSLELIYVLHLKLNPSAPWNFGFTTFIARSRRRRTRRGRTRCVGWLISWRHMAYLFRTPWKIKSKISTWILLMTEFLSFRGHVQVPWIFFMSKIKGILIARFPWGTPKSFKRRCKCQQNRFLCPSTCSSAWFPANFADFLWCVTYLALDPQLVHHLLIRTGTTNWFSTKVKHNHDNLILASQSRILDSIKENAARTALNSNAATNMKE